MIIVDTAFHITFTGYGEHPIEVCIGKCRKVWWVEDFKDRPDNKCPMCNSDVDKPVLGVHYKVIDSAKRDLKFSDFKKCSTMSFKEKQEIKKVFELNGTVYNISLVKPAFEEKAKAEWC